MYLKMKHLKHNNPASERVLFTKKFTGTVSIAT